MAGENEEINYPKPALESVAKKARDNWHADATTGLGKINKSDATASIFGHVPALAEYGKVFEQVKAVYVASLEGARTDLTNVLKGIEDAKTRTTDVDDAAEQQLLALWSKWKDTPVESQSRRDETEASPDVQAVAPLTDGQQPGDPAATDSEPTTGDNTDSRDDAQVPTSDDAQVPTSGTPDPPVPPQ